MSRAAWASPDALTALGLTATAGGVVTSGGLDYSIAGRASIPDYLAPLQPLLIAPRSLDDSGEVSVLVVIADRPDLVEPIASILMPILAVSDPSKVTVATSEDLADLRMLVQGQLGQFSRGLVLGVFAVSGILVAGIVFGLVLLRRKDFGRRRALGASQRLILGLLCIQTAGLAAAGAVVGTAVALTALVVLRDPLPGADFVAALDVLAVFVGTAATVPPAVSGARREPIRELRVP